VGVESMRVMYVGKLEALYAGGEEEVYTV